VCGIVGYVGHRSAFPLIGEGLQRLEYRGYDSAGIAVVSGERLKVHRTVGRVNNLVNGHAATNGYAGNLGIGHTRWATHGRPSVENAHPHVDCTGTVAVVHNGIIENHAALREALTSRGHVFRSATDTEVVAHLLEEDTEGHLEDRLRRVVALLEGEFALAVLDRQAPDTIAAARSGSPALLIGVGRDEHFVASDLLALAHHTSHVIAVEDGEVAAVRADGVEIVAARDGAAVSRAPVAAGWDAGDVGPAGHDHFMHKEIHEQPAATRRTFTPRVSLGTGRVQVDGVPLTPEAWRALGRLTIVACGTSHHAGLIGRWYFEELARIPTTVEIASEFRYRTPLVGPGDVCIFVSQSGETADTLGALRLARTLGARPLAVCNVAGSSLTRDADGTAMTYTGPEIGVASTKAFTAQVVTLFLLALQAGQARGTVSNDQARSLLGDLAALPDAMGAVLEKEERILALARRYQGHRDFFFLGRGVQYPVALEGALKLKEIAYVHAEAFPGGEMKHGPLALIDSEKVTFALTPGGPTHGKMVSTIEEVKARDGRVIALGHERDEMVAPLVDHVVHVPMTSSHLVPCVMVIPLQLFAYHMAVLCGRDVDRPRNLAKSVTVE
jgi:glucosamine--fructose-6-phosphate aminotransferase (isomerizing)